MTHTNNYIDPYGYNSILAPPVVFHYMQVSLQGGQEQLQHLGVGQQLGRRAPYGAHPLEELLVAQRAPLGGGDARLRLCGTTWDRRGL